MRRSELVLLLAFVAALILAGVIGLQLRPGLDEFDPRLSTRNRGPQGALALARTLEELGVTVERRRSPFFELEEVGPDSAEMLALLDLSSAPTASELFVLRDHVEAGGSLFVAAHSGVEGCFSVGLTLPTTEAADSALAPAGIGELPPTTRRLALLTGDSIDLSPRPGFTIPATLETPEERDEEADPDTSEIVSAPAIMASEVEGCRIRPIAVDTLLADAAGKPLALSLRFAGGGRVTVLANGSYLSNESLRETDVGPLVIPWLLAGEPERVVFDEYHHGFGRNRSLWLAAASWLISRPGGWAILQILLAATVALIAIAVRFGPARTVVERTRRSPLEHLEALSMGLRRARGHQTAVELMIEGLRRRSSLRMARRRESKDELVRWLDAAVVASATPAAREAREKLVRLAREAEGDATVLEAAQTVEILWNEMGRPRSG